HHAARDDLARAERVLAFDAFEEARERTGRALGLLASLALRRLLLAAASFALLSAFTHSTTFAGRAGGLARCRGRLTRRFGCRLRMRRLRPLRRFDFTRRRAFRRSHGLALARGFVLRHLGGAARGLLGRVLLR